jgi:DNA modification methylase
MQIKDLILKTEKINWQELKDLQPNNLKTSYHSDLTKESLIKNGFAFTFYIWQDKKDKYIVDGHLRVDILKELKNEGYDVPDELNCTFLDLPDKKTAIRYLLEVFNIKKNPIDEAMMFSWIEDIGIEDVSYEWLDVTIEKENDPEQLEAREDNFESEESNKILTDIVKGDIFEFRKSGEVLHRLMCGDSTNINNVEKLMNGEKVDMVFTDPPYGIAIVGGNGKVGGDNKAKNGVYSEVIGDDTTDTAKEFYNICVSLGMENFIIWGGNYFTDFLPFSNSWIVWDKRGDMNSNNFADGEMAWCSFNTRVRIYTQLWNGMIREGEKDKRVHPTQKPIRTLSEIINDHVKGDLIFDGFLGSGSTMVASHQLKRKCYGMELDEKYCQVIIDRMKKLDSELEIIKLKN